MINIFNVTSLKPKKENFWTQEMKDSLWRLWSLEYTASECAAKLTEIYGRKFSRNSVIGAIHRDPRYIKNGKMASPIKRNLIIELPTDKINCDKKSNFVNLEMVCAEPDCIEPVERKSYCCYHASIYYKKEVN